MDTCHTPDKTQLQIHPNWRGEGKKHSTEHVVVVISQEFNALYITNGVI
jgi:hypothetical protein